VRFREALLHSKNYFQHKAHTSVIGMLAPPRAAECMRGLPFEISQNIYFLRGADNLPSLLVQFVQSVTLKIYSPLVLHHTAPHHTACCTILHHTASQLHHTLHICFRSMVVVRIDKFLLDLWWATAPRPVVTADSSS
jgi:hypothetical protein